jgi:hypothetical protein
MAVRKTALKQGEAGSASVEGLSLFAQVPDAKKGLFYRVICGLMRFKSETKLKILILKYV